MDFKKNILLTGAGFTANFGGSLAREMWSKIFNNPKTESLPEIKNILLSNFDFEEVYSNVSRSGDFSPQEKELFQTIVIEAYASMDEVLKTYVNSGFNQYGCFWGNVSKFLALFAGSSTEIGAHFTLNQDILLERARSAVPLGITATKHRAYWDSLFAGRIDTNQKISLYSQAEIDQFKSRQLSSVGQSYFIKLHGSYGWVSHSGKEEMVLGKNKIEDIDSEPILKWYFELFKTIVNRDGVKLFVIGYSFRDPHINNCIIQAIEDNNIKLYIVSREDPEILKDRLEGKILNGIYEIDSRNMKIWDAICGYFPYKLADIFPKDQTETQILKDIKKLL